MPRPILNDLRRAVLTEIVGGVIDGSDSRDEIRTAAGHAIRKHVQEFGTPVKTTELARDAAGRYYHEEDESLLGKATKVAGAGAAAVGVAGYLRGRAPGRGIVNSIRTIIVQLGTW